MRLLILLFIRPFAVAFGNLNTTQSSAADRLPHVMIRFGFAGRLKKKLAHSLSVRTASELDTKTSGRNPIFLVLVFFVFFSTYVSRMGPSKTIRHKSTKQKHKINRMHETEKKLELNSNATKIATSD
jgi:hypothetical protein